MWRPLACCVLSWLLTVWPAEAAKGKKSKQEAEEPAAAAEGEEKGPWNAGTFAGLALRGIGPAIASGRISDLAIQADDPATYYAAVASGGVWKTVNSGTTWQPIFDGEGSYSIGCVTLDPNNPNVVWVGTGENNSQRSVSYGDGVYKSLDGGKSWQHMGLETSEHIAKIWVDPRDSQTVLVASQGPLWNAGGERGVYRSEDGGKTWEAVLTVDEHTGATDLVADPRDPDVLYAATYQRRRRVWTLINGGPGSAIHKSEDGGKTWRKVSRGLPGVDMGRIGLAVSPANPDVVYAIIEAAGDAGGFFRSVDRGESWQKRSGYVSGSPQYYQEIVADPVHVDRVYSMDTWMQITEDGGASFQLIGETYKHVDNHALWINPRDTDHLLAGCDGGIYESWDRGATWDFKANLPITQFYRITVDNDTPFYNVYGGTQDNFTLGGPSRTATRHGITNREWFITLGGDGFEPQVDPENPDIVYSQWQYGNLHRFDRKTGEQTFIQPQPAPGDDPLRWNWDSALLISPHSPSRLYFTAQRIFRSDDRGDSWRPISDDLTRQLDRNQLEVMGKVWGVDAVAKNMSTSPFGNIVSLSESTLEEGLLYAGTDDGLVQVRQGDGTWRRIDSFPGVPEMPYVSDLEASLHQVDTVYAAFDTHKDGDFAPYLLKSTDRGNTWTSIVGDLPERGTVHTLVEDHVEPDLLFAGTEFGAFFTTDGGEHWVQLKGGLPVIAVRDLDIQRRENDLVVGTFGRGIYILDDYTPLRGLDPEGLEAAATLFPVRDAKMYMEALPLGLPGKSFQGDSFYVAPNPPFGAVFTYYLKDAIQTRKEARQEREKEAEEAEEQAAYPTWDELRAEDREQDPAVILTVKDSDGHVVRRLQGPAAAGFHRIAWNLRYPASNPVRLAPPGFVSPFSDPERGPMVVPGTYQVSLARQVDGRLEALADVPAQSFRAEPLYTATLQAEDRDALLAFQQKTARLQRAVLGAGAVAAEAGSRLAHITKALHETTGADPAWIAEARDLQERLADLMLELMGDGTRARRQNPTLPSITQRVNRVVSGHWASSSAPTQTFRDNYQAAADAFAELLPHLTRLIEQDLAGLEGRLEAAGGPWTPGRLPRWRPE